TMFPRIARRSVMDPTTVFCPNPRCHARGQTGQGNIGIHSQKEQRFICHACHKTFSARPGTIFYRLRTSAETVVLVVTLLAHGCPVQAIVAAFGFDERTIAAWWARAGLVLCHFEIIGYSLCSLTRASSVVNFQWALACRSFRSRFHAWTFLISVALAAIRPPRHCRLRWLSSISAMFNQLPCLGV